MNGEQKPSLDDILSEIRSRKGGGSKKVTGAEAQAQREADEKNAANTLDLYIRYGRDERSFEEITEELRAEVKKKPAAEAAPDTKKEEKAPEKQPEELPLIQPESKPAAQPIDLPSKKREEQGSAPLEINQPTPPTQTPILSGELHSPAAEPETDVKEPDRPLFEKKPVAIDDAPTQSYESASVEKTVVLPDPVPAEQGKQAPVEKTGDERNEKLRAFFSLDDDDTGTFEAGREIEYESPADENFCRSALGGRVSSTGIRFAGLCVFSLLSLFCVFAPLMGIALPALFSPEQNPYGYLIAQLLLGICGGLLAVREMASGLASLFTFRGSTKSLAAAGYLLSVAQLVAGCFSADQLASCPLLMPVSLVTLTAMLLGELLFRANRRRSFRLVTSSLPKTAVRILEGGNVQQQLNRLSSYDSSVSSAGVQTDFLSDFFALSHQADPTGRVQKIAAPVLLLLALIGGVAFAMLGKGLLASVTLAALIPVLGAPMTATLSSAGVLNRLGRHLFPLGAMVSGFETAEALADTNGLVIDAVDLFPAGTVTLHGVKTFENHRIDEALLTVASVVHAAKGTYSEMFLEVVEGRSDILLPVDSYLYEDGMGVSAWISNRRVLVGNRELLMNHGVEVPSRDYENRYLKENRELMYLSVGGELAAMFILCYSPGEAVRKGLEKLHRAGFDIFIKTCDANITPERIAKIYDIDSDILKMLPGSCYPELEKTLGKQESAPAKMAYTGGFPAYSAGLSGCAHCKSALHLSVVLQWIAIVLSLAAGLFLCLTGSSLFTTGVLLLISLFFGLLIWLLPLMGEQ